MRHAVNLALGLSCVCGIFFTSCSKGTAPTGNAASVGNNSGGGATLFPNLDPRRLSFPEGWEAFDSRVSDAQLTVLNQPVTVEEAPRLAETARNFLQADRRCHAHDLLKIPTALLLCSQAYAKAGSNDEAWALLRKAKEIGGIDVELLKNTAFDGIREQEEFQALATFAESESKDEVVGKLLIKTPPLFALDDLLALETSPPLPTAAETAGKVVVIFTGPVLNPDDVAYLEEAAAAGASTHAIVSRPATVSNSSITVHVIKAEPAMLVPASTPVTWFSGKDHKVVAFLRPFSGPGLATIIVNELQKRP